MSVSNIIPVRLKTAQRSKNSYSAQDVYGTVMIFTWRRTSTSSQRDHSPSPNLLLFQAYCLTLKHSMFRIAAEVLWLRLLSILYIQFCLFIFILRAVSSTYHLTWKKSQGLSNLESVMHPVPTKDIIISCQRKNSFPFCRMDQFFVKDICYVTLLSAENFDNWAGGVKDTTPTVAQYPHSKTQ